MHEISLTHTIDTGHRIVGHEGGRGKCARLHGHTYRYEVTVASPSLLPIGFVVDFGVIKKALDEWDHRIVLWEGDPIMEDVFGFADGPGDLKRLGFVVVPFNPTAENMARYWAGRLLYSLQKDHAQDGDLLCEDPRLAVQVEVWETPKSSARYVMRP